MKYPKPKNVGRVEDCEWQLFLAACKQEGLTTKEFFRKYLLPIARNVLNQKAVKYAKPSGYIKRKHPASKNRPRK